MVQQFSFQLLLSWIIWIIDHQVNIARLFNFKKVLYLIL